MPATLTVPGAVASWTEAHARLWPPAAEARCLDSAIAYARDGFPVTARLSSFIAHDARRACEQARSGGVFLPDGKRPGAGQQDREIPISRARLQAIADRGWAGFYEGRVAEEMARFAREAGGFFRAPISPAQKAQLGRAARRPLSRRHHLQHAAADPGLHGDRDAQPARALRSARQDLLGPTACT